MIKIVKMEKLIDYGFIRNYNDVYVKYVKSIDGENKFHFIVNPRIENMPCDNIMIINYFSEQPSAVVDEYISDFDFLLKMFKDGVIVYENNK